MGLAWMGLGRFLGVAGGAGMGGDRPLVFHSPCTWPTWPLTLHNSLLHGVVSGGCVTEAVKRAPSCAITRASPKFKIRGQGPGVLALGGLTIVPCWSSSRSRNT
jgi:hypothetical protein